MSQKVQWWEKSVEYKYLFENINSGNWFMPLDGKPETNGDLRVRDNNDMCLLIEFKKEYSEKCKTQELKKFINKDTGFDSYSLVFSQLAKFSNHHKMVYGTAVEGSMLYITCSNYFPYLSNSERPSTNETTLAIKDAIPKNCFDIYIMLFAYLKHKGEMITDDDGEIDIESMADIFGAQNSCVAISKNGTTTVLPITAYFQHHWEKQLNLELKLKSLLSELKTNYPKKSSARTYSQD